MVVVNDLGRMGIDGVPLEDIVGSPAQRLLVVALATQYPRPVSDDRLAGFLWPGERPSERRLWDTVHRLRRALDAGKIGLRISRRGGGYTFDQELTLDSKAFEELVRRAETSLDTGPLLSIELLDEALGLWRGEPYEGYDLEAFAPGSTARLDDFRLRATSTRARAMISSGDPALIIGELEDLVAGRPFNEELISLLITALHRSGRRVEALRRLRGFQQAFADEVGLDAGPRLSTLEVELLAEGDDGPEVTTRPPTEPVATLPHWRTSFVGRREDAEHLRSQLTRNRLVTIVGPAGVGKTRLAVETARQLGAGQEVRFADLSVTRNPSSVDVVIAAAYGIRDGSPRNTLVQLLSRSSSTLIVDNCEHVADAASDLIDLLLDRTAATAVLATSREPLRVSGEVVVRLEPLDIGGTGVSPAALLFCERSGLQIAELTADDLQVVDEIARRLDGLPLALELAAARIGSMSLVDLAADLDHRFHLLTSGDRTAPPRHQTLRAAVDWSYEQLDPEQRVVLNRCSSFAGRFTLADAARVCSDRGLTASVVRSAVVDLVDASLIARKGDGLPYHLLETLREYGRNELDSSGERTASGRSHGEYFTERAHQLAERSYGPDERAVIDELLAQSDDYRTAMGNLRELEDWENFAELVWAVTTTGFSMRGTWVEPVFLVADIALHPPDPPPPRWAALPSVVASTLYNRGLFDEGERHAQLAMQLAPDWFMPWSSGTGVVANWAPEVAISRGERAVSLSDPDRPNELLASLAALSVAKRIAGDRDGALDDANRLVAESQRFRSARGESIALLQVARLLPGGAPGAAQLARRSFELALSSRTRVAEVTGAMLHVRHLLTEDLDLAAEALAEYLRLPILHSPPGPRILGAATAYFATRGDTEFARRLGNLVGQANVRDFVGSAPVDDLFEGIPAQVDPMSIEASTMEATTELALQRLLS